MPTFDLTSGEVRCMTGNFTIQMAQKINGKAKKMEKVIFVYPKKASFIEMDISILSEKYELIENTYDWEKKIKTPYFLIKQLIFLLKNIRSIDYLIVSFGGYWSLLPSLLGRLFKKPALIILHGTDCAAFKEINYGNIRKLPLRIILYLSYKYSSRLLPVSKSLIYSENTYFSKDRIIKQGVQHFFPKINTKKTVIGNSLDENKWKIFPEYSRVDNRFITVLGEGQFKRKGGDLIIEVADKLPQFEFYFIGIKKAPHYIRRVPNNVRFISRRTPQELFEWYNKSKYYFQLSVFEGFGCALCEAMLCGCIPIVSSVNILPDIVKNTGYILHRMDVNLLCNLLLKIYSEKNNELGKKARKRIIKKFPIKLRKDNLYQALEEEKVRYN